MTVAEVSLLEKRMFTRYVSSLPSHVTFHDNTASHPTRLLDISQGGAVVEFQSPSEVPSDHPQALSIHLGEHRFLAQIVDMKQLNGTYRTRCAFHPIISTERFASMRNTYSAPISADIGILEFHTRADTTSDSFFETTRQLIHLTAAVESCYRVWASLHFQIHESEGIVPSPRLARVSMSSPLEVDIEVVAQVATILTFIWSLIQQRRRRSRRVETALPPEEMRLVCEYTTAVVADLQTMKQTFGADSQVFQDFAAVCIPNLIALHRKVGADLVARFRDD